MNIFKRIVSIGICILINCSISTNESSVDSEIKYDKYIDWYMDVNIDGYQFIRENSMGIICNRNCKIEGVICDFDTTYLKCLMIVKPYFIYDENSIDTIVLDASGGFTFQCDSLFEDSILTYTFLPVFNQCYTDSILVLDPSLSKGINLTMNNSCNNTPICMNLYSDYPGYYGSVNDSLLYLDFKLQYSSVIWRLDSVVFYKISSTELHKTHVLYDNDFDKEISAYGDIGYLSKFTTNPPLELADTGSYTYQVYIDNGDTKYTGAEFTFDNIPPQITIKSIPDTIYTDESDSTRSILVYLSDNRWSHKNSFLKVYDSSTNVLLNTLFLRWEITASAHHNFYWFGRDSDNNILESGMYSFVGLQDFVWVNKSYLLYCLL